MRRVCLLALALSLLGGPRLTAQPKEPVSPLPAEIVAAWEKAGAKVGWLGFDKRFRHVFRVGPVGKQGEVPAFRFDVWRPGLLGRLPRPDCGCGLLLDNTQMTDEGLKELAGMSSLEALDLYGVKVTDAGLKELAGLKSLRSLSLGATRVTGVGLKELIGLKSLQALDLSKSNVTDAGLKELAGLTSLQSLDLRWTKVKDEGLSYLAGLKLKTLVLTFQMTNLGLKHYLAAVEPPTELNLSQTFVTDAGLKELAGLKSLQSLNLAGTQITDAGLRELAALKSLKKLDLRGTLFMGEPKSSQDLDLRFLVSEGGVAELQMSLPGITIIR